MTDDATPAPARSPFDGVTVRDVVRDVVATFALLVALPMPWDYAHRGSDRLDVVLVTVIALLAVVLPYVRRAGVGPGSWDALISPRARLVGCAPYVLVVLVHLGLDVVGSDAEAAVGAGAVLGLAGAVLAIAPTWPYTLPVVAGLVALGAVATPVASLVDGAEIGDTVVAALNALLVLGVLWLTAGAWLRGNLGAGVVLLAVGGLVALELVFLAGGDERPWFESLHGQRLGLLLLPVVAACVARRVLDTMTSALAAEPADARAGRWVSVAVRSLDLVALVAGFVALVAVVRLVTDGVSVSLVLRIVVGVLMVVAAIVARRALAQDARTGHTTAVGLSCVLVVLGLVIVVARAGLGTQANVEELLVTFGLPAVVLAMLLVPASVRELVATEPEPEPEQAAPAEPAYAEPVYAAQAYQAPAETGPAESGPADFGPADFGPAETGNEAQEREPAGAWTVEAPEQVVVQQVVPERVTPQQEVPYRAPMDATQQMAPVNREDAAAWSASSGTPTVGTQPVGTRPAPVADRVDAHDSTQTLPAFADVPGSPWSPGQALDPATPLADLARIVQESPHLRPHVASNPSTYPALLDWLGALGDPAVDAALRARR